MITNIEKNMDGSLAITLNAQAAETLQSVANRQKTSLENTLALAINAYIAKDFVKPRAK